MVRITKRSVDQLAPKETDYFVWDEQLSGFGVRVMPSGAKSYQVQYRASGRTRRVVLGRHGVLTPDEARKTALDTLGKIAKGDNPAEAVAHRRASPTVGTVCQRFMDEHVRLRCKPTTRAEYQRAVDLFIRPAIGPMKVCDVNRSDIAALHHKFHGTPYQANRTLGVLSKMFNLAEVWGLRPDGSNPCRHVRKYEERKRERYLGAEELARLGETLAECERDGSETLFVIAAFRLLILTGCRLREIQELKWEYVAGGALELPDSKTGARSISLPPPASELLASLPRAPDNPFVIAGSKPGHFATDLQKPWRRIRGKAGLCDVRIHDLRHTYASVAVSNGMSIQMLGKLLGHSNIQTTMRYAHLARSAVDRAADENSSRLAQAIGVM